MTIFMTNLTTTLAVWATAAAAWAQSDLGAAFSDKPFQYREVEIYQPTAQEGKTATLSMEYAKAKILTPQNWPYRLQTRARVYEIDLVYTKYPRDTADWLTPYKTLMRRRMNALFALDPSLKTRRDIRWNLVAQTQCTTATLAKSFFHGFVIKYKDPEEEKIKAKEEEKRRVAEQARIKAEEEEKRRAEEQARIKAQEEEKRRAEEQARIKAQEEEKRRAEEQARAEVQKNSRDSGAKKTKFVSEQGAYGYGGGSVNWDYEYEDQRWEKIKRLVAQIMKEVRGIIDGTVDVHDPVVIEAFKKHPEWKGLLVVCDWTGSMYPYGAQLVHVHKKFLNKGLLKHLTLFNDGNDFVVNDPNRIKPIGNAGGIYHADPQNIEDVLKAMEDCAMGGDGGEFPENNIEAILRSVEKWPGDYEKIVMIADNSCAVRDISLLDKVREPIHIIACGAAEYYHPDLMTIAWRTGGSIIDRNDEIVFSAPREKIKKSGIKVGKVRYVLKGSSFELVDKRKNARQP
jgi:hypothetical protein